MVVWNVAEDEPAHIMGAVAAAVWLIGLLGWLPARLAGGRAAWWLGVLVAALSVARQALPGEVLSPALAFATCIAWLWWLPAYLRELAHRGRSAQGGAIVLAGVSAQVAGQTALHGLDLPMMTGAWPIAGATALAVAFVVALHRVDGGDSIARPPGLGTNARGAAAIGPLLFLELSVLANVGALGERSGWSLAAAALLCQSGLLLGLIASSLAVRPAVATTLGLGAAATLQLLPMLQRWEAIAILPIQVALGALLGTAFAGGAVTGRAQGGFAIGALLFFALTFLFHSRVEWTPMWPAAALAMLVIAAWRSPGGSRVTAVPARALLATALFAAVGVGIALVPMRRAAAPSRATDRMTIASYNIHQGLDVRSVPALQRAAAAIDDFDADVVALQEVNRGWSISGGIDAVAWLRWRFPDYQVVFGPMHGALYGNVIMSRAPMRAWGWQRYALGASGLPRGFTLATIASPAGDVQLISTHLTPYDRGAEDAERLDQARYLIHTWGGRARTIVAGDLNSRPASDAIGALRAAGLVDALAAAGVGDSTTYSSLRPVERIDYIFASPDLRVREASVPRTTASDHRPIRAVFDVAH